MNYYGAFYPSALYPLLAHRRLCCRLRLHKHKRLGTTQGTKRMEQGGTEGRVRRALGHAQAWRALEAAVVRARIRR